MFLHIVGSLVYCISVQAGHDGNWERRLISYVIRRMGTQCQHRHEKLLLCQKTALMNQQVARLFDLRQVQAQQKPEGGWFIKISLFVWPWHRGQSPVLSLSFRYFLSSLLFADVRSSWSGNAAVWASVAYLEPPEQVLKWGMQNYEEAVAEVRRRSC